MPDFARAVSWTRRLLGGVTLNLGLSTDLTDTKSITEKVFTMKYSQRAFTLIEIIIAVAIVGILAAIAYPSYTEHINKSREAEARAALTSLATVMTQFHLDNNTYVGASLGSGGIFPDHIPPGGNGPQPTYNLAITSQTASQYTISATPINPKLHTYTLDEAGNKTPSDW